ncbi:MAG: hypothetical protein EU542_00935 [Promethearchaeota archaeon]|nr:MAG: hypothetical protein EU542_00935 [Candidatus Lokiarchaeota archaeon]
MPLFKKRTREIKQKFAGNDILLTSRGANFFGQESKGLGQIRGNGVLLLTNKELYFGMWTPKKDLKIPIVAIKSIENPKSFLGKSVLRKLLKINFINDGDDLDAAAWYVKDLVSWTQELEQLIRNIKNF